MHSTKHWLAINQEWEQSGVNQKPFCQEKSIRYTTFCFHRTKLLKQGLAHAHRREKGKVNLEAPVHPLSFIPIKPAASTSSKQMIEVLLPHGISIRIPAHVSN